MAATPSTTEQIDNCFICGRPSIKNYPLHECATCRKLIHRRCTYTPAKSTTVYCIHCLPEKPKEGTQVRRTGVSTVNSRISSTSKNSRGVTVSKTTPKARLSNTTTTTTGCISLTSSNISPKQKSTITVHSKNNENKDTKITDSQVTNGQIKNKNETQCTCTQTAQDILKTWETDMQNILQAMQEKICLTFKNEIDALHKKLDDIVTNIPKTNEGSLKTTVPASQITENLLTHK